VYSVVHVIKWNMSLNFKDEMLAFNDMWDFCPTCEIPGRYTPNIIQNLCRSLTPLEWGRSQNKCRLGVSQVGVAYFMACSSIVT
jgi:hypothetical protein